MGPGPSLYVARDDLTRHRKVYFRHASDTKPPYSVRPLQFGVRSFDAGPDPVALLPFSGLLKSVHIIPQADLGCDLQTKVADGVTSVAASSTMVGGPYRTAIEHTT